MEPTYHLEMYEGPLDLLLQLIQKNKMDIMDIQSSLICEQFLAYIEAAKEQDLELSSGFITMASELILIKSKMLIPRVRPEEPDPREDLTELMIRHHQAQEGAKLLAGRYEIYNRRMVKDTDEITIDKTFVGDQDVTRLCVGIRSIIAYNEELSKNEREKVRFTPLVAAPIVPVEAKIVGIIRHIKRSPKPSMKELLRDAESLPDLIAIFLGILELVKIQQLVIAPDEDAIEGVAKIHDLNTHFIFNENAPDPDTLDAAEPSEPVLPVELITPETEGQISISVQKSESRRR